MDEPVTCAVMSMADSQVIEVGSVTRTPRAAGVFVVTALGTFMASLDLSIVNVAFPDIEASYRDANYSIMTAGLAVTPGPVIVAIIAGPAGRLAGRIGFRPVLLFGASCFAIGLATYIGLVTSTPNYLGTWLPGTVLVGVGIGFTFPVLSAAAVSSLPPARFAVGSAVNQTGRQIGVALGIAVLVALIGSQHHLADPVSGFHQLWSFAASTALVSGVIGSFIPRPGLREATEVGELAAELVVVHSAHISRA